MISKELLSEVLELYVTDFYLDCETLLYTYDKIFKENEQYKSEINIFELAHKCKEWAYTDTSLFGYHIELNSFKSEKGKYICLLMNDDITFIEETEPEAIFKACQWILENKKE